MKSFMDCEIHLVIPHLIEKVLDFKAFVHGYLDTSGDFLGGHSKSQEIKFSMDSTRWPIIEYRNLYKDKKLLSEHIKGICLWSKTKDSCPKVPSNSRPPLALHSMKSLEEIKKGLNNFVAH